MFNIHEMLKDFGLDDNFDNRMLVSDNLKYLHIRQELYNYHTHYPTMLYIESESFSLKPLEIEVPPRVLSELVSNAYGRRSALRNKYEFLLRRSESTWDMGEPRPKHKSLKTCLRTDIIDIRERVHYYNDLCTYSMYIKELDGDYWYCRYGYLIPLSWSFYREKNSYRVLKNTGAL